MTEGGDLIPIIAPEHLRGDGAVLLEWFIEEGESTREGQPIAQLLGAGGCEDLLAPLAGLLVEHWVEEGAAVTAGQQVATIEAGPDLLDPDPLRPDSG